MKKYKIPFEYTTMYCLSILLKLANKKCISISDAFEVRKIFDDMFPNAFDFYISNENKVLVEFLKDNRSYVYIKNGNIYLKDDIEIKDIEFLLRDISLNIPVENNIKLFEFLKIDKPLQLVKALTDYEKSVENLYKDKNFDKVLNKIKIRNENLEDLFLLSEDYLNALYDIQCEYRMNKEDDYTIYPINKSFYNDRYDKYEYDIELLLNEPVNLAIFSNIDLFHSKLNFDLQVLLDDIAQTQMINETETSEELSMESDEYNDENYDEMYDLEEDDSIDDYFLDSEITSDDDFIKTEANTVNELCEENVSRQNIMFALKYIDEINKYIELYQDNEKLSTVKDRLKYIVDNPMFDITHRNNKQIEGILDIYLENSRDSFSSFQDEARYFIEELININSDSMFLEKLLFVKTYYDLTYDNDIFIDFVNYNQNNKYKIIHNFIISDDPNLSYDNDDDEYKAKVLWM